MLFENKKGLRIAVTFVCLQYCCKFQLRIDNSNGANQIPVQLKMEIKKREQIQED
jgi:hypothetical protein